VDMEDALAPQRRNPARLQRQLDPISGVELGRRGPDAFAADECATPRDRRSRQLLADSATPDQEADKRLVPIGEQPQPGRGALQALALGHYPHARTSSPFRTTERETCSESLRPCSRDRRAAR